MHYLRILDASSSFGQVTPGRQSNILFTCLSFVLHRISHIHTLLLNATNYLRGEFRTYTKLFLSKKVRDMAHIFFYIAR